MDVPVHTNKQTTQHNTTHYYPLLLNGRPYSLAELRGRWRDHSSRIPARPRDGATTRGVRSAQGQRTGGLQHEYLQGRATTRGVHCPAALGDRWRRPTLSSGLSYGTPIQRFYSD